MAIVINEIEVNVEVVPATSANTDASSSPAASKDEIIRECVEKVMEIINQKNER